MNFAFRVRTHSKTFPSAQTWNGIYQVVIFIRVFSFVRVAVSVSVSVSVSVCVYASEAVSIFQVDSMCLFLGITWMLDQIHVPFYAKCMCFCMCFRVTFCFSICFGFCFSAQALFQSHHSHSGAAGPCERPRYCSRIFTVVHSSLLFKVQCFRLWF